MTTSPRGQATRTERLPLDLTQVDAAWLARTLDNAYPGIQVATMRTVEVISGHTTKVRIEASIIQPPDQRPIPFRLCLKANWSGNTLSSDATVNEARFYKDLADGLDLPAPPCFYADWDDDAAGQQGLLVLEDMEPWGGTFGTSAAPITVDQARKGVEALARLHGSTWASERLDRAAWLQVSMATDGDDYWGMMEDYFARHNAIPERVAIFPHWMAADPNQLRRAFRQLCAYDLGQTGPRCLVHGDAHLGNTYALRDGNLLFLDWQIVRKGRPWRDYSYFAIGSIPVEERRRCEGDLLRHYLATLRQYGVEIGFDVAWAEYRRWVVWGLVAWQSNINPKEDTMSTLSRFCAAAVDLRTEELYELQGRM